MSSRTRSSWFLIILKSRGCNKMVRCAPFRRMPWQSFVACCCAIALFSCTTSNEYLGVSLQPDAAEGELQVLAKRARAGDKQAQLELGRRFEMGDGVQADRSIARQLYSAAATTTGGSQLLYTPSVGTVRGAVVPVNVGSRNLGLPEASERLAQLDRKDVNRHSGASISRHGTVRFVGISDDVCETEKAAVQASVELAVGKCRATSFLFEDNKGVTTRVYDLIIITSDDEAVSAMHISLGIIDNGEPNLYSEDNRPQSGTLVYDVISGSSGLFNVIRSFKGGK